MENTTPKITPFLWFDNQAEEAMNFYCSIFPNSKRGDAMRLEDTPSGEVQMVQFELDGQHFMALNGGPHFTFSPAISLFVSCQTQAEVDDLWEKLSEGGEPQQCGWLSDKYGVTWQIIPAALGEMLGDPDKTKSQNVMQAMLQMQKIDIATLREAYAL